MKENDYEKAINELIPQAVAFAKRKAPEGSLPHEAWSAKWNRVYHGEMDRLANEAGLRKKVGTIGN